eukprot:6181702-Pleurochrysis_carterae.AAC.1
MASSKEMIAATKICPQVQQMTEPLTSMASTTGSLNLVQSTSTVTTKNLDVANLSSTDVQHMRKKGRKCPTLADVRVLPALNRGDQNWHAALSNSTGGMKHWGWGNMQTCTSVLFGMLNVPRVVHGVKTVNEGAEAITYWCSSYSGGGWIISRPSRVGRAALQALERP